MHQAKDGRNPSAKAAKYMMGHPIRQRLIDLGWGFDQLESLGFWRPSLDLPFSSWPLRSDGPGALTSEEWRVARGFAALKWLILEDPPAGRHHDDAWVSVTDAMDVPADEIGERTRRAQSERARKPRGKLGEGDQTLNQIIQAIATSPENRDLPPSELIEILIGNLTALGLEPVKIDVSKTGLPKSIEYKRYEGDKVIRRTISYRRFRTVVNTARR